MGKQNHHIFHICAESKYFAPRKVTLTTFTNIAANSASARNVKELIYDGRLFLPELGKFDSYWAAFFARMVEVFDVYEEHTRNSLGNSAMYFADEVHRDSIWNMEDLGDGEEMERVVVRR